MEGEAALEQLRQLRGREALPLPPVVVLVRQRREARLGHQVGERERERQLHRDRPGVLDDEQVGAFGGHHGAELVEQAVGVGAHVVGERRVGRGRVGFEAARPQRERGRIAEVHLGHEHAGAVELAGDAHDRVSASAQRVGELLRLEADAVGSGQPGGEDQRLHGRMAVAAMGAVTPSPHRR